MSLIRQVLWNEAGWCGTAFATLPDLSGPPIIALLFKNSEAAVKIFRAWRDELGEVDERSLLRLAIVRKISRENPYWYRIIIGREPASCFGQHKTGQIAMMYRTHTMKPDSDENLERFLTALDNTSGYVLTHARVQDDKIQMAANDQIRKRL